VTTRTLAVVVSTGADVDRALALAGAARDLGVEAGIFFMDEAVAQLPERSAALAQLAEQDCDLIACAHSAHRLGLSEAHIGILLGSQDDHAALVHRAERVVAFT
jgi:nucleotide-binding universal stress UspA family protein